MQLLSLEVEMKVQDESGTVETVHGSIGPDCGWQQWGAPKEVLGFTVPLIDGLAREAREVWPLSPEDEDET